MNWYGLAGIFMLSAPFLLMFVAIAQSMGWQRALKWLAIIFFVLAWAFFVGYFFKLAGWLS